jgi:hypothetical protein
VHDAIAYNQWVCDAPRGRTPLPGSSSAISRLATHVMRMARRLLTRALSLARVLHASLLFMFAACDDALDDVDEPPFEAADFQPVACDATQDPLPLTTIPPAETLRILAQVDGHCPGLSSTSISVVNISDSAITVDAINLSGTKFQLGRTALPRRLEPMDRLILGQAFSALSDDTLINHTPEVLDSSS